MYLGRFQMFHNGHLDTAKYIDIQPDTDHLIFLAGSAQYSRFNKHPFLPKVLNPFTSTEKEKMIKLAVQSSMTKPYEIISVPDFHVCDRWYNIVMNKAKPDILYTNEPKEIILFEKHELPTRRLPVGKGYHAQVLREMIAYGDNYQSLLPKGTVQFIQENGIENIIREFYEHNKDEMEIVHEMQRKKGIKVYGE